MHTIATFGVWDLFHVGHLNILERAKGLGDLLVVGVASDELARTHKGGVPIIPLEERLEIVKALRCVDVVVPYYDLDFTDILKGFDVDILVVGEDWGKLKEHLKIRKWIYMVRKGRIVTAPYTKGISTKIIRERTRYG